MNENIKDKVKCKLQFIKSIREGIKIIRISIDNDNVCLAKTVYKYF